MHVVRLRIMRGKKYAKVPKSFKNFFGLNRETMSYITALLAAIVSENQAIFMQMKHKDKCIFNKPHKNHLKFQ